MTFVLFPDLVRQLLTSTEVDPKKTVVCSIKIKLEQKRSQDETQRIDSRPDQALNPQPVYMLSNTGFAKQLTANTLLDEKPLCLPNMTVIHQIEPQNTTEEEIKSNVIWDGIIPNTAVIQDIHNYSLATTGENCAEDGDGTSEVTDAPLIHQIEPLVQREVERDDDGNGGDGAGNEHQEKTVIKTEVIDDHQTDGTVQMETVTGGEGSGGLQITNIHSLSVVPQQIQGWIVPKPSGPIMLPQLRAVPKPAVKLVQAGNLISQQICTVCKKTFPNVNSLQLHMDDSHFECKKCNKWFTSIARLWNHQALVRLKCKVCDTYHCSNEALKKHRREAHVKDSVTCKKCKRSFSMFSKGDLRERVLMGEVECSMCASSDKKSDENESYGVTIKPFLEQKCVGPRDTAKMEGQQVHDNPQIHQIELQVQHEEEKNEVNNSKEAGNEGTVIEKPVSVPDWSNKKREIFEVRPQNQNATTVSEDVCDQKSVNDDKTVHSDENDANTKEPGFKILAAEEMPGGQLGKPTSAIKCPTCSQMFLGSASLQDHQSRTKQCELCEEKFCRLSQLWGHIKTVHPDCVQCNNCTEYFKSKTLYEQHREKAIECEHCKLVICSEAEQISHKQMHEKGYSESLPLKPRFKCPECGAAFRTKMERRYHRWSHINVKKCPRCPAKFKLQEKLDKHIMEHGMKFKCDVCGKILRHKETLKYHKKYFHSAELKAPCDICGFKSKNWAISEQHKIDHHGAQGRYKCKLCNKQFWARNRYNIHMKEHDETPVLCSICGLTFKTKRQCKDHRRTHVEAKNCPKCSMKFKSQEKLDKHIMEHDMKFECDICGKILRHKETLKRHKKHFHSAELKMDAL